MSQQPSNDNVVSQSSNDSSLRTSTKYVPPHVRNRILQAPAKRDLTASEMNHTPPRREGTEWRSNSYSGSTRPPGGGWGNSSSSGERRWGSRRWDEPDSKLEDELFGEQVSSGINFDKYSDIPVKVSNFDSNERFEVFSDADLGPILNRNIELAGYKTPTPVQKNAIPIVLAGRDLMACAQTGSGKTAAFLFPTLARLHLDFPGGRKDSGSGSSYSNRRKASPIVLIMAPTRELAKQIHLEARKFCYRSPFTCCVVYGGADVGQQMREMERGCDVIVATPGRLNDLLERGRITLSQTRFFIMDEADRMLDMGFEPQIRYIVEQCDMSRDRQTLMFSATFPREIQQLAQDFLHDYVFLEVGRIGSTTDFITQKVLHVEDYDKKDVLVDLLDGCPGLTLIFVETKKSCDGLEDYLINLGYPAIAIHGDRNQREREAALRSFKNEQTPILVATDVAARGLDIDNVLHVINYDLPNDINDYVHRIGRTGRAGNTGVATAMISEKNINILRDLVELLEESKQEVPGWLSSMSRQSSFGRKKSGKYNQRDFRKKGPDSRFSGPPRYNSYSGSGKSGGEW